MTKSKPVVLVFSGSDPTGGAGLQADVLTLASLNCHPLTVVTSITSQDTSRVHSVTPLASELIREQVNVLMEDIEIDIIKVGMIPSIDVLQEIISVLQRFPTKPVVLDPVLSSGAGYTFGSKLLIEKIVEDLLPRCLIITPNTNELIALSGAIQVVSANLPENSDPDVSTLINRGSEFVLLTGTHAERKDVENILFDQSGFVESWVWPRLSNEYHGSGCTLASAIAAFIANGSSVLEAADRAQEFTWKSLKDGFGIGGGQLIPDRISGRR
ncbi:hydroxymethylpyrimidine/phosphomethylpyrimidine kinase [Burkholderiales bacterium]|nr:hydroxymethylpyrimidine/phosphomethylpyrimidine kinase [Burkholderiales bacterium]